MTTDPRCPVCGNVDGLCEGHVGSEQRVLSLHDKGRHFACSPIGCDNAFDRWIEEIITTVPKEYA